jgi:hypothetical protein
LNKIALLLLIIQSSVAQPVLNANGPGNTYEEINAFFGGTAVETPDQSAGNHSAFGRHIDEIYDTSAGKYVFRFLAHYDSFIDNDVSTTSTDRQRVEIKTYASSPANMKGTDGETVTYKWRFKLPTGFIVSSGFTHLHQVKPVNGDDSTPTFVLTARSGSPDKMQLGYYESTAIGLTTVASVNLSLFENTWVEATEIILVKTNTTGSYSLNIKRVSDGVSVMSYSNSNILTMRSDNSFIRPKWGIYRKYDAGLRDEELLFSDFSVVEGIPLANDDFSISEPILKATEVTDKLEFIYSNAIYKNATIYNLSGQQLIYQAIEATREIDLSQLATGIYILKVDNLQPIKFLKK